uniref:Rx N-terminal domain-containing protein n=1 Tax=Quercus lobata TaxID=97700 RepID=A0A7N2LCF0_QUELO
MDEAILSIAGSIIENLGSAAFELVGSLWNVKDDLEQIRKTDDLLDESKYYTELALQQKETSGSITEKELDAIAKDREKFHWKERSTVKRIVSPNRETRPWHPPNNGVIGRKDEKNQIINRLLEPNIEENVLVVAIVGVAGEDAKRKPVRIGTRSHMSLTFIYHESFVEYGGNMPRLDTVRILDGGVRKDANGGIKCKT